MRDQAAAGSPPALMRELLFHASDGMLAFDEELRLTFWNPAMERLFGLRADEVIGQKAPLLFPFFAEGGEEELLRRALAGHSVPSHERPFSVAATGRKGVFQARYFPLAGSPGLASGGIGLLRDVTAEREAERAVHETETRFRNMADVAPVLLWMAAPDGYCTFFNQTWLDFTGRTLEEEWGVGWAEGVHFEDFSRCMDTYVDAFNARRVFEMEYRLRRKDGEYRWILDRGTPRYEPDGTFAGFIGSCVDITELKSLQEELRASVRMRDEFITIASHELRTPLTSLQFSIDGLARTLDRAPPGGDENAARFRAKVERVQGQLGRMEQLVGMLLDVSRTAQGRLELEPQEAELGALVEGVCERFAKAAARAGSALSVETSGPVWGRWDRLRLEQVVANLIDNAIKYGGGQPVRVRVGGGDGTAELEVHDSGIGIPPALKPRLFERFVRGVSAQNYGGFGVGLWIVRTVVEAHGGRIDVDSAPERGTTFRVWLPATHDPAIAARSSQPSLEASEAGP